jgi:hypothetical protein
MRDTTILLFSVLHIEKWSLSLTAYLVHRPGPLPDCLIERHTSFKQFAKIKFHQSPIKFTIWRLH